MTAIRVLLSRAMDLLLRRGRGDRLSEEIEAHLDLLAREHVARGLEPAAARQAARRAFGGVDQMKAAYRDQQGLPHGWIQMVKETLRSIVPRFCARRMLKEYASRMYVPAAREGQKTKVC